MFSFIIAQHDQILAWLDSLSFVDGNRVAFYGLSYGGETAVRVPTVLQKYCLYAQFGMSDRVAIEFFQGGHSINGKGTFEFLHKHLDWPAPDSKE